MLLRDWRIAKGWSQVQLGEALGFSAASRASQAERIENGKIPADADVVAVIERVTIGAVGPSDMQACRLAWLSQNRKSPRKARRQSAGAAA